MQNFTPKQKAVLLENPNVLKITENHLVFKPEFKVKAVEFHLKGMTADEILIAHGFDSSFFEKNYFRLILKSWKLRYELKGKDSFLEEDRGKGATGRPKSVNLDEYTLDDLKAIVYIQDQIIEEIKKKKALAKK